MNQAAKNRLQKLYTVRAEGAIKHLEFNDIFLDEEVQLAKIRELNKHLPDDIVEKHIKNRRTLNDFYDQDCEANHIETVGDGRHWYPKDNPPKERATMADFYKDFTNDSDWDTTQCGSFLCDLWASYRWLD